MTINVSKLPSDPLETILAAGLDAIKKPKAETAELEQEAKKLQNQDSIEKGMMIGRNIAKPENLDVIGNPVDFYFGMEENARQMFAFIDSYSENSGAPLPAEVKLRKSELESLYNSINGQVREFSDERKRQFFEGIFQNENAAKAILNLINNFVDAVQRFAATNNATTETELNDANAKLEFEKGLTPKLETSQELELERASEAFRQYHRFSIKKYPKLDSYCDFFSRYNNEKLREELKKLGLSTTEQTELFTLITTDIDVRTLQGRDILERRLNELLGSQFNEQVIKAVKRFFVTNAKLVHLMHYQGRGMNDNYIDSLSNNGKADLIHYGYKKSSWEIGRVPNDFADMHLDVEHFEAYETPETTALFGILINLMNEGESDDYKRNEHSYKFGIRDGTIDPSTGSYFRKGRKEEYKKVYETLASRFEKFSPEASHTPLTFQSALNKISGLQGMGEQAEQLRLQITELNEIRERLSAEVNSLRTVVAKKNSELLKVNEEKELSEKDSTRLMDELTQLTQRLRTTEEAASRQARELERRLHEAEKREADLRSGLIGLIQSGKSGIFGGEKTVTARQLQELLDRGSN